MLKCFYPCFRLGLLLSCQRESAEQVGTARSDSRDEAASAIRKYRSELLKKMTEAEHKLMTRWEPETAGAARRMVTVWLDEILIKSTWPGREQWLRKPLQSEWGEGRSGGLWFFQQLEGLNPARKDDRQLAVLALRCISLGLTGCYGREPDRLNEVRRDVQERFALKDDTPIFPPPLPTAKIRVKYIGSRGWRLLAVLILIPFLFWLLGGFSLNRTLSKINIETPAPASLGREQPASSLYGNLRPSDNRTGGHGEQL